MPLLYLIQIIVTLLYGIADYIIQAGVVRMGTNKGKLSKNVKIISQKLHWLPVKQFVHVSAFMV